MTREDAVRALSSPTAGDRLRAARFFTHNGDRAALELLRNALRQEAVTYVRTSIELAIRRVSDTPGATGRIITEEVDIPPDVRTQLRIEITAELTSQLLHEISSPVGLLAAAAAREIHNYDQSRTKRLVESLKRVFEAIEHLKTATAVPRPAEFDLGKLLVDVVAEAYPGRGQEISLIGPRPMLVNSDPGLLRLALSNGVRNAVEAISGKVPSGPHAITATWGQTDVDCWVVVLDGGPGIIGPLESAFDVGTTTKKGNYR